MVLKGLSKPSNFHQSLSKVTVKLSITRITPPIVLKPPVTSTRVASHKTGGGKTSRHLGIRSMLCSVKLRGGQSPSSDE
ncbi:hypothetical protein E2C01_039765 [Portunus trituberculatus]|uniref:Uncharacterized protein n=1 Tax=Portunus trituberculatus TaxID=210409 RepID=A0A5B7FKN0_PORTR|nr:hypothetical protein [Portunus trituberculatus]